MPIHVYSGSDPALRGKTCIVLGKERNGIYAGKYNFFGGKRDKGEKPVDALLREIQEEMCVSLTMQDLNRCVIGAFMVGGTMVVFAHVTGLSRQKFASQMAKRKGQHACRREMVKLRHIPLADIKSNDLSTFVHQQAHQVFGHAGKIDPKRYVIVGNKWC